ncbi:MULTISPECIES: (2Fe-2S)-binding protein [Streptomyces]|uniref:(2Fe-2S)-binding protein n=1 Tax=Streptomyces morookaense TaxID=1970 RepID=A0A7Y7E685_STRMO|nr:MULTISPECIES: (2Fe-2S)-binding protein [Streptomyces]MCC2277854.1 (2Fe-2S)-binding protein [Streptomyces sp. ET3-23]NVK76952.1 (2Fe-2S)-binding protein [Streptomyces morookaense]GHF22977.1 hypothetical protein GCM10010359_26250 [Streptomyces morookaense]
MRLHRLADIGPFFGLTSAGGGFPLLSGDALRHRIRLVGDRLGTDDRRVAASVAYQGIAGRLLSVALGAAVLTGEIPDLAPVQWDPAGTAPDDLRLPDPAPLPPSRIAPAVLHGLLVPLHDTTRALVPVSSQLLWGNAGSSLAGSLRVLHTWCMQQGRVADGERALALARGLFEDPLLRDTGTFTARGFVRRTCCLYYRVPSGGGTCGDCVLRHPPRAA